MMNEEKQPRDLTLKNVRFCPGQRGSVGWSIVSWTEGSQVPFTVGEHAPVAGSVTGRGADERQPIDVSLPLSFLPYPRSKINKHILG